MKKTLSLALAVVGTLVLASTASAAGYYASKADERNGVLTQGTLDNSAKAVLAGGDTCGAAVTIPAGGAAFADTGDTTGGDNTVTTLPSGCSNYTTVAGPDLIYTYQLGLLANRVTPLTIVVQATGGTGYDPAIYNLSTAGIGCPAGTGNVANNCMNGADATVGDGTETITDAETDAMAAGTYFLFIDSFYTVAGDPSLAQGAYSLTMGRPLPVELMEFSIE
jgi:hypothetical protein